MSNIGAASAASTTIPVPVLDRKVLWSDAVTRMRIPATANAGLYESEDGNIPYLQFARTVRGGLVNFFVHTGDDSIRGKTATFKTAIKKKTFVDGREYLYVDLVPANDDVVTHRLVVMNRGEGSWLNGGSIVFETPDPISGVILLVHPDAKVVPVVVASVLPKQLMSKPKPKPATKASVTGDSQLNRLLADGWEIDSENATSVKLCRMKGDVLKTMVHHRPKIKIPSKKKRT